ncbi:hypothetical protein [Roseobacter litoralis]|uniref:hypothetical protein n=1 Tax=Roseobacter litoralis TaxID=42443 RepID=UPI00249538C0|nr:hypothetical protein [Roseobacter litoralis]
MIFHGQQAISPPTRATGRTVLFFALLLGLARVGWIDVADTSLLGLKVEPEKFVPLLQLLGVLAVVAHVVQWYGDFVSYRGWNVSGKQPADRFWNSHETKLEAISKLASDSETGGVEKQKLLKQNDQIIREIAELRWSINSFGNFAKFYVFGWHLALPVAATVIAFSVNRYA